MQAAKTPDTGETLNAGDQDAASIIVWVGLPEATADKVTALRKVFLSRVSTAWKNSGLPTDVAKVEVELVLDEGGNAVGLAIMTAESPSDAALVERKCPTVPLDKKHIMRPILLTHALELLEEGASEGEEGESALARLAEAINPRIKGAEKLSIIQRADQRTWLDDPLQRAMFLMRADRDTNIYWFDQATGEPVLCNDGEAARAEKKNLAGGDPVWTNGEALWSPQGSYLCTLHNPGVRLWAGDDFHPVARLQHRYVTNLLFSPDEQFLVTWNGARSGPNNLVVHSVLMKKTLFTFDDVPSCGPSGSTTWPLVAWSHDSRYLAVPSNQHGLEVYELPDMKKLKLPDSMFAGTRGGPMQFAWQPNSRLAEDPVLAVWTASAAPEAPCRLAMYQFPSMRVLASKNLFAVDGMGVIQWQQKGDHCSLVTSVARRVQGKKKVVQSQIEVFRMRERNLPVDSVALANVEKCRVFWSPAGDRFAVLSRSRRVVSFYAINQIGTELAAEIDVPMEMNSVVWNPNGNYFVIASQGAADGTGLLWFGYTSPADKKYTAAIALKDEMNKLGACEWDPSGRFLMTSVTMPIESETAYRLAGAAGYAIWSFQGRQLYQLLRDKLHLAAWRPEPLSMVNEDVRKEIAAKLQQYSKKFDQTDSAKKAARRQEVQKERKRIFDEFYSHVDAMDTWLTEQEGYDNWTAALTTYSSHHPVESIVAEKEEELSVVIKPTNA